MTAADLILAVTGALTLYLGLAVALGRFCKAGDPADSACHAQYPPPVPAPTQADVDATWLDAWPADVCGTGEIRRRFDDIVRGGLA
jgi:hypothetical protein